MKLWTDEQLMKAYKQGDFVAFEHLYTRYKGKVNGYILKKVQGADASEIFQQVFMKLHRKKHLFDEKYYFAPWFFTLIKNEITDFYRKDSKVDKVEYCESYDKIVEVESEVDLEGLISKLKPPYREIITMRYLEDLDFSEMAIRLDTTEVNMRKKVSRGIDKLKNLVRGGKNG